MPKWLRKSLVVMVTVLTFGLITPSQLYEHVDKPPKGNAVQSKSQASQEAETQIEYADGSSTEEDVIGNLMKDVERHSYTKFGERIRPVIEDEFKEIILPNIEKAIERVAFQHQGDSLKNLVISEIPTGGDSEKIFHIANKEMDQEIIRFHVRKDHPPQAGYWFNFHYHTYMDEFEEHHDLGSIYWDKNTPPKWMS